AEPARIEREHGVAGVGEQLGVVRERLFLHARDRAAHGDRGGRAVSAGRAIEMAGEGFAGGREANGGAPLGIGAAAGGQRPPPRKAGVGAVCKEMAPRTWRRYAAGVTPSMRGNHTPRWAWSEKPAPAAASAGVAPAASSVCARLTRTITR